ncbi:MAG TPA: flagellar hook-associated protein FlgL [Rhodanobacteraceae bacterium]
MNIATSTYFDTTLAAIDAQQASLNTLNNELATGKRVNQPSDDPVAFSNAQRLSGQITALGQLNADDAQLSANLGLGSQTLNQILNVVNSVKSIAVQAANGTTSTQNRTALNEQVTSLQSELLSLANTRNGNGVYIFGGSRGETQPFAMQPNGTVVYQGDGATQLTHTGESQSAASLLNGGALTGSFDGNGYGVVTAAPANAGSASATVTGLTSGSAAQAFRESASPYTISFSTVGGQLGYTVTRGGTVVSTGAYTEGMTLPLSGMDVAFSGTPQNGDAFTLAPAKPTGLFAILQQLSAALSQPVGTASSNAQNNQSLDGVIAGLNQAQTGILSMQSTVGVAMRAIQNATGTNSNESLNDQSTLSSDVDANEPAVLTRIDEQTSSLNAAMTAFGKLSQLSLFNYIQP